MSVPSEGFTADSGGMEPRHRANASPGAAAAKTVTMAAVARVAGISQGAISSLLNDRDYGIRVSPRTRERVFKICRDLGYVPNDLRALVRIFPELGETCLLVSDRIPKGIANPFVSRLTAALMERAARQPASIAVIFYDETKEYDAATGMPGPLKHGTASRVMGVGNVNQAILNTVHARHHPAIVFGHNAHVPGVTSVVPDYARAAVLALELLVRNGHRRIGIVSGPFGAHDPRLAEISMAMSDAAAQVGITIDPADIFSGDLSFEAGVSAVAHLRDQECGATALVCFSECAAVGVIAGAGMMGMHIPEKLSVVTFADQDGPLESCIAVSAVVLPVADLAAAAVEEADRQIREGLPTDAAKITIDVRLVERATCGPAPAR